MKVKIKKFDKEFDLPSYEKDAAGFDFLCAEDAIIKPNETKGVKSGVALEIPSGFFLMIVPRSSTFLRKNLTMPHSLGIIDPFYKDNEIKLIFYNPSSKSVEIKKGEKLAQGILMKYEQAEFIESEKLERSERITWSENMKE